MRRFAFAVAVLLLPAVVPSQADESPKAEPVVVPFQLLKTRHMAVRIKINGKGPYRVIFDTGAPLSLINTRVAKDSGLLPKTAAKAPSFLGIPIAMKQERIKVLEVGELRAKDVPVVVMDHPTVEVMNQLLGPIEGIVGFSLFARYRTTVDYQNREMTFEPNGYQPADVVNNLQALLSRSSKAAAPKVIAPAALWGLVVDKEEDDEDAGVTIKTVLAGSAAARAGLRAGDRLLTLDDRWTDTVIDCYAAAAHVKPGTAVKVVIRRDEAERELTVTPDLGL